ncbi:MAG: O-antigen ligase family protein [Phycisphaeraceae bacterium JB051]
MILIIFGLAVLLGVILFFVLPPRCAAMVCLIGGWCLLPTANFMVPDFTDPTIAQADEFTVAATTGIGTALIGPYWLTRSTVIGITVLLGMLLADFKSLRRLKPKWFDIPMAIWCIAPLFSGLFNQLTIEQTLLNLSYHMIAWGGPYIAGRLYFSDIKPMRELGISLVIAGLIYAPLCIIEGVFGPLFYELLYQYHPYYFDGIDRAIGYRPVLMLEHGSQLGIWMPAIALLAFWMHMCRALPKILFVPSHVTVLILVFSSLFTQSLGGIGLMMLGMVAFALIKRGVQIPKPVWAAAVVCIVGIGVFVAGGDQVVGKVVGQGTVNKLKDVSRLRSLGWRVNAMTRGMEPALKQPVMGLGQWDWWQQNEESKRPVWNLFLQGMGEHGLFAAMALLAVFVIPLWQFITGCPVKLWSDVNIGVIAAMAMFLFVHLIDSMLNPTFSTSLICVAGGLNTIGPFLKRALKSA